MSVSCFYKIKHEDLSIIRGHSLKKQKKKPIIFIDMFAPKRPRAPADLIHLSLETFVIPMITVQTKYLYAFPAHICPPLRHAQRGLEKTCIFASPPPSHR